MKPKKVRRRLRDAQASCAYITVTPRRGTSEVDGYVARVGKKWVAMAVLDEGLRPDGLVLFRMRNVHRVHADASGERLRRKMLRRRGDWPPNEMSIGGLDRTGDLLRGLAAAYPVIAVRSKLGREGAFYEGAIEQVRAHSVLLRDLTPAGRWGRRLAYCFDEILSIDVGDSYQAALLEVAGRRPKIKRRKGSS